MAKLRPITNKKLTDPKANVHEGEIEVKEGQQFIVADFYFKKNKDILFFYYWDDESSQGNQFYTYPIQREDAEWHLKHDKID